MSVKPDVTLENLEEALWMPEDYHWGPSTEEERFTQGGGTAVFDKLQNAYVFKETPDWWTDCRPGDLVPEEWGIL